MLSDLRCGARLALPLASLSLALAIVPLASRQRVFAQGDICADAILVSDGQYTGSTAGASEGLESLCGSSGSSPDRWYRYEVSENGVLSASTCGSEFDTILSVHSECPATAANELACDDDTCELQSSVTFAVDAGAEYWIRISGYSGAFGDYTLSIEFSAQVIDEHTCAEAIEIGLETVTGSTQGAGTGGTSSCGSSNQSPDRWYRYTAAEDCLLTARTCGSSFDTVLSIFDSCGGRELDCNDDGGCVGGDLHSIAAVSVEAGSTYLIRVSGFNGASGDYVLELSCDQAPEPGAGADLTVASLGQLSQVGRLGDRVAVSMSSTICNVGSEPIDWIPNPNPRHPFLAFNLYRLRAATVGGAEGKAAGRMEQIGQSWAKHGFAASQSTGLCGLPCRPDPDDGLGTGCADIYGAGTNATQSTIGRRDEIDPFTGAFEFDGSHLDVTSGPYDPVEYRLNTTDADLDPARNAGSRYFIELYVVAHDDVDHANSLGWQEIAVTGGAPGGTWRFALIDSISSVGPALDAWPGATRSVAPEGELTKDGRVYVYSRASDAGDGFTRYEYAVYNLDLDRAVAELSVPLHRFSLVRGVGSHSAPGFDDGYSNEPWTSTRLDDALVFSTTSEPFANSIRWGTSSVFWFETDAEPVPGSLTLRTHRGAAELVSEGEVPSTEFAGTVFRRGDADGDGTLAVTDPIRILGFLFSRGEQLGCFDAADANDDNTLDISDAVVDLLYLFSSGRPPPAPGPTQCGLDPTPSAFPACVYDRKHCP